MAKWYRIYKNVEYSTDFDFFFENQIFVSISGNVVKFCSRIEQRLFFKYDTFMLEYSIKLGTSFEPKKMADWDEVRKTARKIHQQILNGEFGVGKLVN